MLKKSFLPLSALLVSTAFNPVFAAEEQHGGDVQPYKAVTQIMTNGGVFEGDFGDLPAGLFATDDPGFDVDTTKGALAVGNWLRYQAVGHLKFWNGSAWVANVPNGERIEIKDVLNSPVTTISVTGVSNPLGTIGAADAQGDVHQHIEQFSILNASNTQGGTVGAYRIQLNLLETKPNSDKPLAVTAEPIALVFNRGMADKDFDVALAAAADIDLNAVYDANGKLTIQNVGVKALQQHFQVELQFKDNLFVLTAAKPLVGHVQNPIPAFYELNEDLVIPRVKALGKYYKAVLHHTGDFKFKLISADEITASMAAADDHAGHDH